METKIRVRKRNWIPYKFGGHIPALEPFDLHPVTDIPIRLAVEQGVIPRKRDLNLFRTREEWNGHPPRSIVIAAALEEGQPFAVWIGGTDWDPNDPRVTQAPVVLKSHAMESETGEDPEEATDNHSDIMTRRTMTGIHRPRRVKSGKSRPEFRAVLRIQDRKQTRRHKRRAAFLRGKWFKRHDI
ncbi:MAG: hypothetical protein ACE15F_05925 [bacterium]